MKIIVEIHKFHDLFQDLLPWTDNFNEGALMRALVDDLNGILNIAVDVAEHKPVDFELISNTMDFLCTESSVSKHISQAGLYDMKLATTNALIKMFEQLSRVQNWPNNRYKLVNHSFRPQRSREHLNLVLEVEPLYDYPRRIQTMMIDVAKRTLESFCEWDNRTG